jgi:hypothetical protein
LYLSHHLADCNLLDLTMKRLLILFCLLPSTCEAFQPSASTKEPLTRRFNFFQDLFDGAFENDSNLSSTNKLKGMLEGPNSVDPSSVAPLTDVQRAWRERQTTSTRSAPFTAEFLQNSVITLNLYLAGVPSKDPSNDLYGSRVNISSRNKELGLDLPQDPNGGVEISFLPDGICRCTQSPFTSGEIDGEWKTDGTQLRFSIDVLGYSRSIQTKGSIERVFWSDQPEVTRQTSSEYSIPPGWVYADIKIDYGNRPGTLDFKSDGVLRVEQKLGLLGAASKLIACGTFDAKVKQQDV